MVLSDVENALRIIRFDKPERFMAKSREHYEAYLRAVEEHGRYSLEPPPLEGEMQD